MKSAQITAEASQGSTGSAFTLLDGVVPGESICMNHKQLILNVAVFFITFTVQLVMDVLKVECMAADRYLSSKVINLMALLRIGYCTAAREVRLF